MQDEHATTRVTLAVAMPVHDVADYVDEALASLAAQTRPPDEIIVVDDASTDDTAARVRAWAARLPLTLIELDHNVGCGAARAVAVEAATSTHIAPFDGDDVWLPDHLAQAESLCGDDTIVATAAVRWRGGDYTTDGPVAGGDPPDAERQPAEILERNFLVSGSVYPRQAMVRAGGASDLRTSEDRDNWIRLIHLAGCRAVPVTRPTVLHRLRPGSLSYDEGGHAGAVVMLERYLEDPRFEPFWPRIRQLRKRRIARLHLLAGFDAADAGEHRTARREMLRALATDPSLRGGARVAEQGSVALRAIPALAAPGWAGERRRRRITAAEQAATST